MCASMTVACLVKWSPGRKNYYVTATLDSLPDFKFQVLPATGSICTNCLPSKFAWDVHFHSYPATSIESSFSPQLGHHMQALSSHDLHTQDFSQLMGQLMLWAFVPWTQLLVFDYALATWPSPPLFQSLLLMLGPRAKPTQLSFAYRSKS